MQRSTHGFLTTHTGSLPRPADLVQLMYAKEEGQPVDPAALAARVHSAVAEIVQRQVRAGITVVNDGEMSKPSYATYVKDRLAGFGVLPDDRILSTPIAVVAGLTYNFLPFMTLPLYASLDRIDPRLIEAAADLYARPFTGFRKVTFPLIFPGVLSAMLFAFTLSYDEFSRTLFASGRDLTLPLAIYGTFSIEIHPNIFAFGVLTTLFSFSLLAVYAILMTLSMRRAKRIAIQEES